MNTHQQIMKYWHGVEFFTYSNLVQVKNPVVQSIANGLGKVKKKASL